MRRLTCFSSVCVKLAPRFKRPRVRRRPSICGASTASIPWRGVTEPRLCSEMQQRTARAQQTAYQVLVASTPGSWRPTRATSGTAAASLRINPPQIVYAGQPLQSRMHCRWKVRLWDAVGEPTPYSKPAAWSMGLLNPGDFQAKWIGPVGPMTYPIEQGSSVAALVGGLRLDLDGRAGRQCAQKRPGWRAVLPRFGDDSAGSSRPPRKVHDHRRRQLRIVRQREAGWAEFPAGRQLAHAGDASRWPSICGRTAWPWPPRILPSRRPDCSASW